MSDLLSYAFIQHAIIAAVFTSILCGVIGALIVVNRMAMLTGGIAHAAYGGVGLATYFSLPVFPVTLVFGLLSGLFMAGLSWGHQKQDQDRFRSDVMIGVIWAGGMALGILLLDMTPGYNVDLMSYLFGGILSVNRADLWIMASMTVFMVALTIFFYRSLVAVAFDADFAETRGVPVKLVHYLLVAMAAVAIVLMIRVVGLILVVALVSIPSSIAMERSRSFLGMMGLSSLLSFVFMMAGLVLSMVYDLSASGSIIAVAVSGFMLSLGFNRINRVSHTTTIIGS